MLENNFDNIAPQRLMAPTDIDEPTTETCCFCKEDIKPGAIKCKHCGSMLRMMSGAPIQKQDNLGSFLLGLFFGPVGLWSKGQWAAGFAWITIIVLVVLGTGGFGLLLAPFFWIGMAIHAGVADEKR